MKKQVLALSVLAMLATTTAYAATCNAGSGRFSVVDNGQAVKDNQTGLVWQRCALGQKWDGSTCAGKTDNYTPSRTAGPNLLAKDGYRLPSVDELQTLVINQCNSGIKIDTTYFPNTWTSSYNDGYWTSTPYGSSQYHYVSFSSGEVGKRSKDSGLPMRGVRNDMPTSGAGAQSPANGTSTSSRYINKRTKEEPIRRKEEMRRYQNQNQAPDNETNNIHNIN